MAMAAPTTRVGRACECVCSPLMVAVLFRLMVFRPFVGECIEALVQKQTPVGIRRACKPD